MATTRVALSSVLGTVTSVATAVGTTFETATDGIGMLHSLVKNAARHQTLRHAAEESSFEARLIEELSMSDTVRQLEIKTFTDKSQDHLNLYLANEKRVTAAINVAKGIKSED